MSHTIIEKKKLFSLIMDEDIETLYRKREEEFLESELKRFQSQLRKSRPKFRGPYPCSRRILASSDDVKFWAGISGSGKKDNERLSQGIEKTGVIVVETGENIKKTDDNDNNNPSLNLYDPCPIVITIKDKPITESREDQLELMRKALKAFKQNVVQQRQLRDLKVKVQERITKQRLEHTFHTWRTFAAKAKTRAQEKRDGKDLSKERKIELFVNAISEKQKELAKAQIKVGQKSNSSDLSSSGGTAVFIRGGENLKQVVKNPGNLNDGKKNLTGKILNVVEPPAKNRLNAQRKIIAEQKAKLAEQNRIIEDLKLRQIEKETKLAGKETLDVAKEVLVNCGGRTRRSLVKLMREEGCKWVKNFSFLIIMNACYYLINYRESKI